MLPRARFAGSVSVRTHLPNYTGLDKYIENREIGNWHFLQVLFAGGHFPNLPSRSSIFELPLSEFNFGVQKTELNSERGGWLKIIRTGRVRGQGAAAH